MKILIIERSAEIIKRLEQLITETTGETTINHAVSYSEAINHIQKSSTDIVLMDIRFAQSHSFELLKKIKKNNKEVVIIILFHTADEYSIHQCKANGASYLFDKYEEFEKIPSVISQARLPFTKK